MEKKKVVLLELEVYGCYYAAFTRRSKVGSSEGNKLESKVEMDIMTLRNCELTRLKSPARLLTVFVDRRKDSAKDRHEFSCIAQVRGRRCSCWNTRLIERHMDDCMVGCSM